MRSMIGLVVHCVLLEVVEVVSCVTTGKVVALGHVPLSVDQGSMHHVRMSPLCGFVGVRAQFQDSLYED